MAELIKRIRSLLHRELFRYSDAISDQTLQRHGAYAVRFSRFAMASCVAMAALILEILISSPGLVQDILLVLALVITAIGLLSMLPGIVAACWMYEVARECNRRRITGPDVAAIELLLGNTAMRVCLYFILFLIAAQTARESLAWQVALSILTWLIMLIEFVRVLRARLKTAV